MAFKVKVKVDSKNFKKKVERFASRAIKVMASEIKVEILKEIEGGRSPVKGFGRFQKYSKSYLDQISMKLAFRTNKKTGGLFALEKLSNKELKQYRASKEARIMNAGIGDKIQDLNDHLKNKRKSPVNLKVSGDLLDDLSTESTKNEVKISFDNELFDIHNNKGAGKSKVIRRMLPTKKGETFSRSITLRIREIISEVKKSIFG